MERLLGLEEDGYWSQEDQKAAGGLTAFDAWKDYQQGRLQGRSRSGMSMEEWSAYKSKQTKASDAPNANESSPAVQRFISGMMTKEQAASRGVTSKEWEAMVLDRFNSTDLSVDEFEQLEKHYGLDVAARNSNTSGSVDAGQKMPYTEYRQKTAAKKAADLGAAVQRYFNDYQLFANSAASDIRYVRYDNAVQMLEARIQTAAGLRKRADALITSLETSGDILSGDLGELLSLITSTQTGVDSIMDAFGGYAAYSSRSETEEEFNYRSMSSSEIAAEQDARAAAKEDFGIVFELSRTHMPYDWSDASYWGYTKEEFDEVESKRKYIEEKYGVDLHADIYENVNIYNGLLDKLASLDTDIAYTTKDGQNVTLQMLYDRKVAEEESVVWQLKYSGKTYAELRKVIAGLTNGEEKAWLLNYAQTKKTKDDWEKELSYSQAELDYLLQLQSERDRLMEFQAMSSVETPGYVQLKKQWDAYHNQFDDLDERIDALEKKIWEQERIIKYYDLHRNKDYFEKSQYHGGGSVLQRMVNNPELTGDLDKAATVGKVVGAVPGIAAHIYDELTYDNLHYMEAKEREDFNYINETEGEAAAKEYLEWLQPVLNERSMNKKMEWVSAATQSVPVLSQAVVSQLSTPIRLVGGGLGLIDATGQKIRNAITGENKPIDDNTDAMFYSKAASTIRGTVAQNIVDATGYIDLDEEDHPVLSRILNGKSLADLYLLGMGVQDSTAVVALAMISPVLGKLGTVLLATSTGTEVMLNTVSKGGSDEQALTMGILAAAFEMIFEKYELESLLGQGKNAWQAFWRQGLSEAVGEGATEAASILADIAVMAEKSDWRQNIQHYLDENPDWDYRQAEQQAFIDAALQVGEAGFSGWLTGSFMGGGYSKIQNIADSFQKNRQTYNLYAKPQQELVPESLELNPNNVYAQKLQTESDAAKLLSNTHPPMLPGHNETAIQANDTPNTQTEQTKKESKNPTAESVEHSQETVQTADHAANVPVNQEDVAKRLMKKGCNQEKSAKMADAIAARLNGQELTKTQRERLNSSLGGPAVQSVISELMKKKAVGIDSTQNNVYDEINTIGGNKNGRETALRNLSNQGANGSLQSIQNQTRTEDADRSGVPGTLREIGGLPPEAFSAAQRRGLTSDLDVFGDNDYATVTVGSALHQVQKAFLEEYGIECYVIKDSSWTKSSPAYSRNGVVYIREGIDLGTLSTAIPHEATHVMKQENFQPYVDFISRTPDALNLRSTTVERLLGAIAKHKNIDPFNATSQQLFSFYDELNAMGNHAHLLLKVRNDDLETIFKRIGGRYVYYYNVKYQRIGHLFQDRFRSEPVDDDAYFLTVLRYIHQNLKAKLCSKVEDYPFSSFAEYLHESTCVDTEFALSMIDRSEFSRFNNAPNTDTCMEYVTPARRAVTDTQAQVVIEKISHCKTITEFQGLDEKKKERFIKKIYGQGVSIRQLSRLTGITKGKIERILKS